VDDSNLTGRNSLRSKVGEALGVHTGGGGGSSLKDEVGEASDVGESGLLLSARPGFGDQTPARHQITFCSRAHTHKHTDSNKHSDKRWGKIFKSQNTIERCWKSIEVFGNVKF